MESKEEKESSIVAQPVYKELPPQYKPYNPTKAQKRKLERLLRKKRS